ncbi:hypothetical protein D3C71_1275140 [compost metagenome]
MALHHVAQRTGARVIGIAAIHAIALGDQDVHRFDEVAVPHRLQQRVAETQCHQVLHRRLAEVVVQAEHAVFVDQLADGLQDFLSAVGVRADRLFQHQAVRRGQCATQCQPFAGGDVQARRDRQVAHALAVDQVLDRFGHRFGVAQVHRTVVDAPQKIVDVVLAGLRHGLLKARTQQVAELVGVMRRQRQCTDAEVFRQQSVAQQAQQGGEQIALGQITCGTEQEEGVMHGPSFVCW